MLILSLFGPLCLFIDLTINNQDLLTFPTFLGFLLIFVLLLLLKKNYKVGHTHHIVVCGIFFAFSLLKSLQATFSWFGNAQSYVALVLWAVQIAMIFIVALWLYDDAHAFSLLEPGRPENAEVTETNRRSAILTIVLITLLSALAPFFSWIWEYSSYIICGLKLLVAIPYIIAIYRFIKRGQHAKKSLR